MRTRKKHASPRMCTTCVPLRKLVSSQHSMRQAMPSRRTNHTHTIRNHVLPQACCAGHLQSNTRLHALILFASVVYSLCGIYCWVVWNIVYICPNCYLGQTKQIRALPWGILWPTGPHGVYCGLQAPLRYIVACRPPWGILWPTGPPGVYCGLQTLLGYLVAQGGPFCGIQIPSILWVYTDAPGFTTDILYLASKCMPSSRMRKRSSTGMF